MLVAGYDVSEQAVGPVLKVKQFVLHCLILRNGTGAISRNVSQKLQRYAAEQPGRLRTSSTPWQKPDISQNNISTLKHGYYPVIDSNVLNISFNKLIYTMEQSPS
jgi:hypothetical protein